MGFLHMYWPTPPHSEVFLSKEGTIDLEYDGCWCHQRSGSSFDVLFLCLMCFDGLASVMNSSNRIAHKNNTSNDDPGL